MGEAIIHWSITIRDRKQGWLSSLFYYRFRELLTHTLFRYELACPIFCLMPDHIHMVWIGLSSASDQLNAIKHFRTRCHESLERIGFELKDQAYDHVFKDEERVESEFRNVCDYIARNPERAGLVEPDQFAAYSFTNCLVPGYPELNRFDDDFHARFDRIISFLRKSGLQRRAE